MEEKLTVLAEVAVGLAGFSSVVVVFRRRSAGDAWKPEDVFRFKVMLQASLVAGLFAVLPGALGGLGFTPSLMWPIVSGMLLLYILFDQIRTGLRFGRLPSHALSRSLAGVIIFTSNVVIVVQVLNIADRVVSRGPGPYVFGVTWLTIYSGLMFYRLITAPIASSVANEQPAA